MVPKVIGNHKASHIHGTIGVLVYDEIDDKVRCHMCGKWYRGLNTHVLSTHKRTVDEYREEFGLDRGQPLICKGTIRKLSVINKELGHWRRLCSQTMTKDELKAFLTRIRSRGYELRPQSLIQKSASLKKCNPMSTPDAIRKRINAARITWYGSQIQRQLSRVNFQIMLARIKLRNIHEKKWVCTCGGLFPIRKELREHKKLCSLYQACRYKGS